MIDTLKIRYSLIKASIVNTFWEQTAYFGNNLGSVFSTIFYSASTLLFINILYSNVDTFAGYSEQQMIFLILIAQTHFYLTMTWSHYNTVSMMEEVRNGNLDLLLTKPVPSLFYVSTKKISILNRIQDGLPNIIILAAIIKWGSLNVVNIPTGILIFLLGNIAHHCFRFLFALPVFWYGESKQIFSISGSLHDNKDLPLEGFSPTLRNIFTTIIPTLLAAQLSVSVMLGKSNPANALLLTSLVTAIFLVLKTVGWRLALRSYSSASS